MKLSVLIGDLDGARLVGGDGAGALEVGAVRDDSRAVEPGDVFVAVRGLRVDGHDFVDQAVARGAAALVVERELGAALAGGRPQVVVAGAAEALGVLCARAAGRPADRMALVGVTGTNGKTTSTYLMEAVLAAAGRRPGVVGTVSYRYGGQSFPAPYTTPTPAELQRVFGEMAAGGTHRRGHGGVERGPQHGPDGRGQGQGRRVHQPHPGSPRPARRHGRVSRGQGAPVLAPPRARRRRAWSTPTIRRAR